jgi:DNA-binding MarR family transcriptional regulator
MTSANYRQGLNEPDDARGAVDAVRALARAARVLERASNELSMPHYRVLSAIAAGEERASRVAERLELGRPAISSAVDALCRGGLLVRAEVQRDQRAVDLHLTPEGFALLERVEAKMVRVIDELCDATPNGRRVIDALASLGPAVDEMYANRFERLRRSRP